VVLVVVSDVEGEGVDGAVVRICLLGRVYGPMLGDPPRTEGVQKETDAEERREKKEKNGLDAEGDQNDVDEQSVSDEVEECGPFEWLRRADEPNSLENGKEREPSGLTEHRVPKNFVFDWRRHVWIFVCLVQKGVVLFVEVTEGNTGRDEVGGVAEEEEEGVQEGGVEYKVVCQFVNKNPLGVANKCSDAICQRKYSQPRQFIFLNRPRETNEHAHSGHDPYSSEPIYPVQLLYLGMRLGDLLAARPVGLEVRNPIVIGHRGIRLIFLSHRHCIPNDSGDEQGSSR